MMGSVIRNVNSDQIIRTVTSYLQLSPFFSNGWGNIEVLQRMARFQAGILDKNLMLDNVYKTLENTEIKISKGQKLDSCMTVYKGEFKSPMTKLVPKALPPESETVHFQLVLPNTWKSQKPICLHLAGTGDHFFWRRRRFMAGPLAKDYSIGSIILENPFYGYRKPKNQVRSAVNHVSDIFAMGTALLVESVALLLWCQRKGFGPLGITGISMGGHMATVAASGWFEPLAIVPCLSWSSAGPAFTDGVLSHSVKWDILEKQLQSQPEYQSILRKDEDFLQSLKTHYVKPELISHDQQQQSQSIEYENIEDKSRLTQMYSNVSTLLSNIQLSSYIDFRGKRFGPMALELDFLKYLQTVPRNVYNTTSQYLKINQIREMLWTYDPNAAEPSAETKAYMTALMDQATHLSNFNKPHQDSPVIFVVADHDRYIPREYYHVTPKDIYPQTEVRTIDTGHVLAVLQHQDVFRTAIKDAFQQLGCTF